MKILVVAATESEIKPFLETGSYLSRLSTIDILITGVGMVATAYALGNHSAKNKYDFAINVGIAGSFSKELEIGEVVLVREDIFSEMGAENGDEFIALDQLGFGAVRFAPLVASHKFPSLVGARHVKGVTVNKVHGCEDSIREVSTALQPEIETMEGAAFFFACNRAEIPSLQLRAISNRVERRNRESWNIPLAVKNLNKSLIQLIEDLL